MVLPRRTFLSPRHNFLDIPAASWLIAQSSTEMAQDTRDTLVDAAARLFHEQGFAATGVATILREADANSGSLYHFFPTKEALLVGVLERYIVMLRPVVVDPIERQTDDPIGRVFALLAW